MECQNIFVHFLQCYFIRLGRKLDFLWSDWQDVGKSNQLGPVIHTYICWFNFDALTEGNAYYLRRGEKLPCPMYMCQWPWSSLVQVVAWLVPSHDWTITANCQLNPWNKIHMGKVTKLWLSCYLVLLSTDGKTRRPHGHLIFIMETPYLERWYSYWNNAATMDKF